MSNRFYPSFKEKLLRSYFLGESPASPSSLKAVMVDDDYVYDIADSVIGDIDGLIGTGYALNITDYANGIVVADDIPEAWTELTLATPIQGLILYNEPDSGDQDLVCFIDQSINGSIPGAVSATEMGIEWDDYVFALVQTEFVDNPNAVGEGGTPTPTPTPTPETFYVGGKVGSTIGGSLDFDFTNLLDSEVGDIEPEVGDFFVIICGWAKNGASAPTLSVLPAGTDETSVISRTGSDSIDSGIRVYTGWYESGSETGGTVASPGGSSTNLVGIYVFRGVDTDQPMDVTPLSSARSNGCDLSPPNITPFTEGARIICAAVSGSQSSSSTYNDPEGFINILKVGRATTYDGSIILAQYADWESGEFVPGLFDFDGGDNFSSACAVSLAIRPAAV